MRPSLFTVLTVSASIGFLLVGGWRWHQVAAAEPDRLEGTEEVTAVLLVQSWDCPDRTAAMIAWIRDVAEGPTPIPFRLGVVGDADRLPPELDALPRLDRAGVASASRAVQRSGVPGTPALLIVAPDGTVVLTDTFATDGPGPRLAFAANLLPQLHTGVSPRRASDIDGR